MTFTPEEIAAMAEEAGFLIGKLDTLDGSRLLIKHAGFDCLAELERFADLVSAKKQEECAQVCDAERDEFLPMSAKNNGRESDFAFGSVNSAERIASAIRASGQKGGAL